MSKNTKKNSIFTNIIILFGILVVIFYVAVMIYYYQQYLFFPKKTVINTEDKKNIECVDNEIPEKNNETKQIIEQKANLAIQAIEDANFVELSKSVHPQKGIRFSPYAYVKNEDIVFTPEHLKSFNDTYFWRDNIKYPWGYFDGSGEPIEKTFVEYYYQFIYDRYYSRADHISYNESVVAGNTINNALDYYPNSIVVEYYFQPINPKYGGMDWSALRLVFEKYDNDWFLIGIIHDQWTI